MVQMYDSNFYAIFGPKQYCQDYVKQFKEVIVPYVIKWKDKWKKKHHYDPATGLDDLGLNIDKVLVYLPINEGDSNRSKVEGDDFRQIILMTLLQTLTKPIVHGGCISGMQIWTDRDLR